MKKVKTLIYVLAFSSPRVIRSRVIIVRVGRDKQYRFHGRGCECTYGRPKSASARSTERKWVIRVFARTSAGSEPPVLQRAINYANWSSGYRSGTAMHVNVRKDICFPSACIRSGRTDTYVRTICTPASEKYTRASVHVRDKCRVAVNARMHLKEILPDVRFSLIRGYCRSSLTFQRKSKDEGICRCCIFRAGNKGKIVHLFPRKITCSWPRAHPPSLTISLDDLRYARKSLFDLRSFDNNFFDRASILHWKE